MEACCFFLNLPAHRPQTDAVVSSTPVASSPGQSPQTACLSSLSFGRKRNNTTLTFTLRGPRSHAPWAEGGFSNRTLFLLQGSVTVGTFLKPSPRQLLRLCLRAGVAGGSPKSRRSGLVDRRLPRRREWAGFIGGELRLFLFASATIFGWNRKCVDTVPAEAGRGLSRERPMSSCLRGRGRTDLYC